ncbi:MAG: SGNH/GDSL hydrolase family protein [Pseudomonas sp.]|jgi:lysophospholipase L1-like esterase|nr:SGNH/GDSL hydrolase family protein [Pseudomonas sp.]
MLDRLQLMALAPLLLWQGRKVRNNTLRLPEAAGVRTGCLGQGQPLRLLLLGDSAAAGVGVSRQEQALAGQLSKQLSRHFQVTWQLLAESGLNCQQLLNKLDGLTPQSYDCVVLSIGVNDVTGGTQDRLWLAQLQLLRERLCADFNVQHIFISAIPPMQYFTALPAPLSGYLGRRARRLNRVTERLAERCDDLCFMPIELGVDPQMLADDGFHPSALAYRLWAEQVVAQIKVISFK